MASGERSSSSSNMPPIATNHRYQGGHTDPQDLLRLPYPVQHGLEFLRLVETLKPFATNDQFISRIRWDAVSDSLHRKSMFLELDGRGLEASLRTMLYTWDEKFPVMCERKIKAPCVPERICPTSDELADFKSLLKITLKEWDIVEEKEELQRLNHGDTVFLNHTESARVSEVARKSLSRMRREGLDWLIPTPIYPGLFKLHQVTVQVLTEFIEDLIPNDDIPLKVNEIRLDFLYHFNRHHGRRPGWLGFLESAGIRTIGDLGGWGPSMGYAYTFHRRLIKATNIIVRFRNDMALKEKIDEIRWGDIEAILNGQPQGQGWIKVPQRNFQPQKKKNKKESKSQTSPTNQKQSPPNSAPQVPKNKTKTESKDSGSPDKSTSAEYTSTNTCTSHPADYQEKANITPHVFNKILIEDIWIQTLHRKLARPTWLSQLRKRKIRSIADLGGWYSLKDVKGIQKHLKNLIEKYFGFDYNDVLRHQIESIRFADLISSLDETKRVSFQRGSEKPAEELKLDEPPLKKRKTKGPERDNGSQQHSGSALLRIKNVGLEPEEAPDREGQPISQCRFKTSQIHGLDELKSRGGSGKSLSKDPEEEEDGDKNGEPSDRNDEEDPTYYDECPPKIKGMQGVSSKGLDAGNQTATTNTSEKTIWTSSNSLENTKSSNFNPANGSIQETTISRKGEVNINTQATPYPIHAGFLSDYRAIRDLSHQNHQELHQLRRGIESSARDLTVSFKDLFQGIEVQLKEITRFMSVLAPGPLRNSLTSQSSKICRR